MKILIALLCLLSSSGVDAGYLDDVGFTQLKLTLGSTLATGSGVLPTLVEAPVEIKDMKEVWSPDPSDSEIASVTFVAQTPVPAALAGLYSPHATGTARRMVGTTTSMAPGVPIVDVYESDDWLTNFLGVGAVPAPLGSDSRIANHSWVGEFDTSLEDIDALQRVDWLINRDEFIQVVGNTNGAPLRPLLANAYNVIGVGRTDGSHSNGSLDLDAIYTAGRENPHLVAPLGSSSGATAVVTSAATVLIDTARSDPTLSLETDIVPRSGTAELIKSAATSEVTKAVLMAGADRVTQNPTAANISDYRASAINQTSNGLDTRFGAGQLNINTSHEILSAGEQNSLEDVGGSLLWQGFDYDPAFGGANSSNGVATYAFTIEGLAAQMTAALVWNLSVDEGVVYSPAPRLYNLDLELWKLDSGGDTLVASSTSTIDNTENLWTDLMPDSDYLLRVISAEPTDFLWDYALAWHVQAVPLPAAMPMIIAALVMLGLMGRPQLPSRLKSA